MKAMFRIATMLAGAALAFGCDDEGEGGAKTEPIEDMATIEASKQVGTQSSQLASITTGTTADAARGPITTVGGSIQQLVGRHQALQAQEAAGAGPGAGPMGSLPQGQTAEEGTVTFEDGHLSADVSYAGSSTGGETSLSYHYVVEMDITANDLGGNDLDGTYEMDFQVNQASFEIAVRYDAKYDALKLDGMGCPVGGGISVDYAYEYGGEQWEMLPPESRRQFQQSQPSGVLSMTFGPNCGDVALEGS